MSLQRSTPAAADPFAVLIEGHGIATSPTQTFFDQDTQLWTVAVDVGLGEHRASVNGLSLSFVGASGFGRADTMLRAAGEAVERFALLPPPSDDQLVARVPAGHELRQVLSGAAVARASATADSTEAHCLPAYRLTARPDDQVLLPVSAINDPVAAEDGYRYDPSPSGAAAALSTENACLAALLESIERDAAQCAWRLRPTVDRLDHSVAIAALVAAGRSGRPLAQAIAEQALELSVVLIPTGLPDLTATMAFLVDDRRSGIVGAGCAVGVELYPAVVRAGREALQVFSTLRRMAAGAGWLAKSPPDAVVDELSRARLWTSEDAVALAEDWLLGCRPIRELPAPAATTSPPTLTHLASELAARGLDPLVCDLTYRLPADIRRAGWHAVKAVVVGHQQLRMNEDLDFTWCHERLDTLASLWTCDRAPTTIPHPLI